MKKYKTDLVKFKNIKKYIFEDIQNQQMTPTTPETKF